MKNDPYIVAAFLKAQDRDQWTSADGTNPIVTISRQHGTEGEQIAMRTAEILTDLSHGRRPWIAIDKNMAEQVINHHHLPRDVASFLTEEQTGSIQDYINELFDVGVPAWTLVEKMTQTILHLAKIGHVVLLGRAAHLITAGFPRAAHVRIIGSFKRRVERIMAAKSCSRDVAEHEIKEVDGRRRKFVSTYFHVDLDDPGQFDLVFNADRISVEETAHLIAKLVDSPDFRKKEAHHFAELRHQVLG